jgi:hypothetical protein
MEGDTLWHIAQRFGTSVETIRRLNPVLDERMLTIGQILCLPGATVSSGDTAISESVLGKYLRTLWEQHVFWTRLFIISAVFNLPDIQPVTDRLLRNPRDFAAALTPFYGAAGASKFSDLLTAHLTIAAQLVKAAMQSDAATVSRLQQKWHSNADDIAAFLGSINPHWPREEWRRLLDEHLAMTTQEVVDFVGRRYADSVSVFDRIEKEALEMADLMTTGLVHQFPGSFIA